MVAAQEQPFMWIFKDLNRKSCTKGTICVIVLVFIFSAAKLSTDNSQRDNSPKYAAEGQIQDFVCSSSGSSNHREAKKGRRKQIHKPASVPYQSLQEFLDAHVCGLASWEEQEVQSYEKIYYYKHPNHTAEFYEEYDRERVVPGDHVEYRYEVLEWLGCGGVGAVLLAEDHGVPEDDANRKIALKSYNPERGDGTAWKQEKYFSLTLEKSSYSDGFVKYLRDFTFRGFHYLVFELQGPSVGEEKTSPHNETVIRKFAHDMVSSLYQMHQLNMVHYDIKPANYMYVPGATINSEIWVRLGDFSSTCQNGTGDFPCVWVEGKVRTRGYNAPEVLLGMPYDTSTDMFSLGVSLLELYNGHPPFPAPSDEINLAELVRTFGNFPPDMVRICAHGERYMESPYTGVLGFPPFDPEHFHLKRLFDKEPSDNLYDFVQNLLMINPALRMSSEEALQHPFLDPSYFHEAL